MGKLENAFSHTEIAAESMLRATNNLASLSKQMQKAAQQGNIIALKRSIERLRDSLGIVQTEVQNANNSWMMTEDEEVTHLTNDYIAELHEAGGQQGLEIFERDGAIVTYPSKAVVLPKERAVRVDGKKVSTIRPSFLVKQWLANQKKKTRSNPQQTLEAIYKVYRFLNRSNADNSKQKELPLETNKVIPLMDVYDMLTALPGIARDYDRMDFARDLYFLDISGFRETKNGIKFEYMTDTGARAGRGTFIFVDRHGMDKKFHSIQFGG